jgi:hypothetical protein
MAPGGLAAPLLLLPPAARLLRRLARSFINEDAALVPGNPLQWRQYEIEWREGEVRLLVDGASVFATPVSPRGRLGLVIWIDNQYAAFPPSGKLRVGTSPNPTPAVLEVADIAVNKEPS